MTAEDMGKSDATRSSKKRMSRKSFVYSPVDEPPPEVHISIMEQEQCEPSRKSPAPAPRRSVFFSPEVMVDDQQSEEFVQQLQQCLEMSIRQSSEDSPGNSSRRRSFFSPELLAEARKSLGRASLGGKPKVRTQSSVVQGMSPEEIACHFKRCLQLFTENKITIKNTWSCMLIDVMKQLVANGDDRMDDLQVAGCTLDASTKIYATRVDALYQEMLTTGLRKGKNRHRKEMDGEDDAPEEGGDVPVTRRRVKKRSVIAGLESVNCQLETVDCSLDPWFLPDGTGAGDGGCVFVSALQCQPSGALGLGEETPAVVDPGPRQVTVSPIVVSSDAKLFPRMHDFWLQSCDSCSRDDEPFPETCHEADTSVSPMEADIPQDSPVRCESATGFTVDAEPMDMSSSVHFPDADVMLQEDSHDTVERIACGPASTPAAFSDLADLLKALSNQSLEYSYFSDPKYLKLPMRPNPRGPRNSKAKLVRRNKSSCQESVCPVDFSQDPKLMKHYYNTVGKGTKFSPEELTSWTLNETTNPPKLAESCMQLLKLFHHEWPQDLIEGEPVAEAETNQAEEPSDDFDPVAEISFTEHPDDLGDMVENLQEDMENAFQSLRLVEAPFKVPQTFVPFATRPNTVNMKKLKDLVWELLRGNKENASLSQGVRVSWIYEQLLSYAPTRMAQQLGFGILFSAVLHLANEHSLVLSNVPDYEDVIVYEKGRHDAETPDFGQDKTTDRSRMEGNRSGTGTFLDGQIEEADKSAASLGSVKSRTDLVPPATVSSLDV